MLNTYFWNKKEKIFQIDLNSDLKEEWFEPVMPESWIRLNPNVGKYASVCVTLWVTPKYAWNITCLNKPEF